LSSNAQYSVGIDLGTTNCVIAAIDLSKNQGSYPEIITVPIIQRIDEESVDTANKLPSFLYYPTQTQRESLIDFEHDSQGWVVGIAAQSMGRKVSGRLVTSAKSWMCHNRADKRSAILPWGGSDDVDKISPLKATELILKHLKYSWEKSEIGKDAPLEEQILTITLPASFDQLARELTLEACANAGMAHAKLLEEPQAAFYNWISLRKGRWEEALGSSRKVLVCDIGGGTSDFSLVECFEEEGEFKFNRVAVGDHLLLGGDNMDLGLAHLAENKISTGKKNLNQSQWLLLSQLTRHAKETLLGNSEEDEIKIRLPGSGTKVIGGLRQTTIAKDEVEQMILNGFFINLDYNIYQSRKNSGIKELGLPYEQEPAVTWHILDFIKRHQSEVNYPDAILFNGGALEPDSIRNRIVSVLNNNGPDGSQVRILESDSLADAVARGAAFYGFSSKRGGVKIGGGIPVAFYLGFQNEEGESQICIIPKGTEAHEPVKLDIPGLEVKTNTPVAFPLYQYDQYPLDETGHMRKLEIEPSGNLNTLVKFGKSFEKMVPVDIEGEVSELDTLNLILKSKNTEHNWKLEFDLRSNSSSESSSNEQNVNGSEKPEIELVINKEWVKNFFDNQNGGLIKTLEKEFAVKRHELSIPNIRNIADHLLDLADHHKKNAKEEARWLTACSYCMRPGFGHQLDESRRAKIWSLFKRGPNAGNDTSAKIEWAILWRRGAPGLESGRQNDLYQRNKRSLTDKKGNPVLKSEGSEYWRLMASLEHIPVADKEKLGNSLLSSLEKNEKNAQIELMLWAVSRFGARLPVQASIENIINAKCAQDWTYRLMKLEHFIGKGLESAIVELCRKTDERSIDVDTKCCDDVVAFFEKQEGLDSQKLCKPILEYTQREVFEQSQMLGENLPVGLRLN
jgi:hypothetical protein